MRLRPTLRRPPLLACLFLLHLLLPPHHHQHHAFVSAATVSVRNTATIASQHRPHRHFLSTPPSSISSITTNRHDRNTARTSTTTRATLSDGKSVLLPNGSMAGLSPKTPAIVSGSRAAAQVVRHICFILVRSNDGIVSQCAGSILSADKVLTSAHCFFDFTTSQFVVTEVYVVPAQVKRRVGPVYVGRYVDVINSYDPTTIQNDVAVITLNGVIRDDFGTVRLPTSRRMKTPRNDIVTVAGYGRVGNNKRLAHVLRSVDLKLEAVRKCRKRFSTDTWGSIKRKEVLCAVDPDPSGKGKKAFCDGDSGGPLFYYQLKRKRILQIGIASFNENECSSKGATSWFTNLKTYSRAVKDLMKGNLTQWDRRLQYTL